MGGREEVEVVCVFFFCVFVLFRCLCVFVVGRRWRGFLSIFLVRGEGVFFRWRGERGGFYGEWW